MVCVLQCISLHVAQIDHFLYNRVIDDRVPPSEVCRLAIYICLSQKKITENAMIKIVTDEEVHEMDIELIELFAVYLFDRDVAGMTDLIYVVEDRMSDDFLEDETKQHLLMQR